MFNVGGMELIAVALVALVVLGPDKLSGALRQTGALLARLRQISDGVGPVGPRAVAAAQKSMA